MRLWHKPRAIAEEGGGFSGTTTKYENNSEKDYIEKFIGWKMASNPDDQAQIKSDVNTREAQLFYYHGHGRLGLPQTYIDHGGGKDEIVLNRNNYNEATTQFLGIVPPNSLFGSTLIAAADVTPKSNYRLLLMKCCFSGMEGYLDWIKAFRGPVVKGIESVPPTYIGWPWICPQAASIVFADKFFEACDNNTKISVALDVAWLYCKTVPPNNGFPIGIGPNTIGPSIYHDEAYAMAHPEYTFDIIIDHTPGGD